MAHAQSPKIITDGLVFCYDMGNKKSWRGRPTDNLFYTTAASIGIDSQTGITTGSNQYGDYFIKSQAAGAQWWGGLRILNNGTLPLTSGSSYVFSIEVMSPQTGWSYSYDSNQLGGDWGGNDLGRISADSYFVDSLDQSYGNIPNVWKRLYYKVQMKTWSTGGNAYPNDSFYPSTDNILLYYRNPQLELSGELSPFIGGSRSSTDSLVDLTNGNIITIPTLSYNTDNSFSFNGTTDYLTVAGSNNWAFGYNGSVEQWIYPTNTTGNDRLWCVNNNATSLDAYLAGSTYGLAFHGGSVSGGTVIPNTWNHVCVTYNNGVIQAYINGIAVVMSGTTNGYNISNNSTLYIGEYQNLGGYKFHGKIAITRVYNRTLLANEVVANFNALRGRFGV